MTKQAKDGCWWRELIDLRINWMPMVKGQSISSAVVCFRHRQLIFFLCVLPILASADPVRLGDTGLSITLPAGWAVSSKKPQFEETFGAFESADKRASIFFSPAKANADADMRQIMDGLVQEYEKAFLMRRIGEIKIGRLADSISAFAMFDADLQARKGPDTITFRFYLTVIDVGPTLYVAQASVQAPVDAKREGEILAILRSMKK